MRLADLLEVPNRGPIGPLYYSAAARSIIATRGNGQRCGPMRVFVRSVADPSYDEIEADADTHFTRVVICAEAPLAFLMAFHERDRSWSRVYRLHLIDRVLEELPPPEQPAGLNLWISQLLDESADGKVVYIVTGQMPHRPAEPYRVPYVVTRMDCSTGVILPIAQLTHHYA